MTLLDILARVLALSVLCSVLVVALLAWGHRRDADHDTKPLPRVQCPPECRPGAHVYADRATLREFGGDTEQRRLRSVR